MVRAGDISIHDCLHYIFSLEVELMGTFKTCV